MTKIILLIVSVGMALKYEREMEWYVNNFFLSCTKCTVPLLSFQLNPYVTREQGTCHTAVYGICGTHLTLKIFFIGQK